MADLAAIEEVYEYTQTCYGCPEQYEGQLTDGRFFYFRYRYGVASLGVSDDSLDDACRTDDRVSMNWGDDLQGAFDGDVDCWNVFRALLKEVDQ